MPLQHPGLRGLGGELLVLQHHDSSVVADYFLQTHDPAALLLHWSVRRGRMLAQHLPTEFVLE